MNDTREREALSAYLKLLRSKGASEDGLNQREQWLLQLLPVIAGQPADGLVYREAVESLIEQVDRAQWPFFLAIVREYFPFWIQDIKAIAALNAEHAFELAPMQWQPVEHDLKTLWHMLDKEKFGVADTWPLKAYTHALRQEGAEQTLVDTRVRLVKLLLLKLKDVPERDTKVYRIAVDATVALFSMKPTQRLFLSVVREYYYFWIGDPEAMSHIQIERIENIA
ncbi:hypothetical protein LG201_01855 [Methylobacillus gramineus]|uniref:hypothetical protein n=1 Tax=Methylobacillus gramineus TaxID=755169 RepID=UPI001CFF7ED7|nr:hypothetical protein [Methylobacillus gramineus]MCB5183947.1 hypothetical protein [Methylobacillus gramineus]